MDRLFSWLSVDPEREIQRAEPCEGGDQQYGGDGCGEIVPLMSERLVEGEACEGDAGKKANDDLYVGDISSHIIGGFVLTKLFFVIADWNDLNQSS